MAIADYAGKTFCLLLVDESGESVIQWGWTAEVRGGELILARKDGVLPVAVEWLERIRPVDNDAVREIFKGADFWLQLLVGPALPTSDEPSMVPTGMKWPTDRARE